MVDEAKEEDLLRSIAEVEARILDFRKRVSAVLADIQPEGRQGPPGKNSRE